MTTPVDLSNLREMTDGDAELEAELFKEFNSSSESCIQDMQKNCTDGANESFRASAHAMKGTSVNLGADRLGELCKIAQDNHAAPAGEKEKMVSEIKAEFEAVKQYLSKVH